MMRRLLFLCSLTVWITVQATDKYPKNPAVDIQHYQFELTLTDNLDNIQAVASINALFKLKGLSQLRFDLVNESQGKGMTVKQVKVEGRVARFSHDNNVLLVELGRETSEGESLEIQISYEGVPATGFHIRNNKYGDRTFFSDNWPDLTRNWLPVVDHVYDKATCEFIVKAPVRYQVVSNGLKLEETNIGVNTKLTHWKQSVPLSPWLYVLGVAEFAVQYVDTFEGKSIQTWVFPQDRDAGFSDFHEPTKDVLAFYSDYVGPFAYEKLANIQASSVAGGMEAASAILYNEKSVTGDGSWRWKKVVIHEVAHQWFGCAVTEYDWDDVWLSEGFATFFTALFIERAYGPEKFVEEMKLERKQVIDYLAKNPDLPVVHNSLSDMSKVTSPLTYQKGSWVLHMLRNKIGDEKFKVGIRSYYKKYFNATATTDQFIKEMEFASGTGLTGFFRQWLNQGGYPKLKGTWRYNKRAKTVEIELMQTQQNPFDIAVEVGIFPGANSTPVIKELKPTNSKSKFSIPIDFQPERLELDPRTIALAEWEFVKK